MEVNMKQYWLVGLSLALIGCSNTIDIEDVREYKCGEQIIRVEFLDDESVIINNNGTNTVLAEVADNRYENSAAKIIFQKQHGDYSLSIDGHSYPICQKLVR